MDTARSRGNCLVYFAAVFGRELTRFFFFLAFNISVEMTCLAGWLAISVRWNGTHTSHAEHILTDSCPQLSASTLVPPSRSTTRTIMGSPTGQTVEVPMGVPMGAQMEAAMVRDEFFFLQPWHIDTNYPASHSINSGTAGEGLGKHLLPIVTRVRLFRVQAPTFVGVKGLPVL